MLDYFIAGAAAGAAGADAAAGASIAGAGAAGAAGAGAGAGLLQATRVKANSVVIRAERIMIKFLFGKVMEMPKYFIVIEVRTPKDQAF